MNFDVSIQGADQLIAKLREAPSIAAPFLKRALAASQAVLAKHTVKGVVPWRTGFLTQSFRAEMTDAMLKWFPTADYAPYVEFGTKPHDILPRDAKALYWEGAAHPVSVVHHPGTRPNQFMERIVSEAQPEIDSVFVSALRQITAAIAAA